MSDNDSILLSEELFNKLFAYRIQYEEYNLSEPHILKKLFNNLTRFDNIPPQSAVSILKDFYLFNTFQITQSEINDILDNAVNHTQNNNLFNLPPELRSLFNRYPILTSRIRHSLNHNYPLQTDSTVQSIYTPSRPPPPPPSPPSIPPPASPIPPPPPRSTLPINRRISLHPNVSPIANNQMQFNNPQRIIMNTYDNINNSQNNVFDSIGLEFNTLNNTVNNLQGLRLFSNPIFSTNSIMTNVINNQLLNNGIRHTSPANIIFSNNPGQIMGLNYTSQIVDTVSNMLRERITANNQMVDIPIVLKDEAFNILPKYKYTNLDDNIKKDYKTCPISMQEYEEDTELVKLPCNHYFSVEFAKTWLLENSHKCPVCRASAGETRPKI
jgi:hypothetical protein